MRSGYAAAISMAITAPVWWPTTDSAPMPSASARLSATSAQCSIESLASGGRDESPKPIVSIAIAWKCLPSSGSTSRYSSHERGVWCSSSTGRPAPAIAQWIVPAGTSTKRRVIMGGW